MRATVHALNCDSSVGETMYHVILDGVGFVRAGLTLGNPALVRDDKQHEIAKAPQSRKRLRVEINLSSLSKKSRIFDDGAVAVKEYCWFLHNEWFIGTGVLRLSGPACSISIDACLASNKPIRLRSMVAEISPMGR